MTALAGDSPRHNLPLELSSFVGRKRERAELHGLLDKHRLVTLTGTAGCGKTRLALRVAAERVVRYPLGVWFVDLAALHDEMLVASAIAGALGSREQARRSFMDTIAARLAGGEALIVLDNCEHLIRSCARVADELLRRCPKLRILGTTREALAVAGETILQIAPLPLPDRDRVARLEKLATNDAVQLFLDRARSVRPEFVLTKENAPFIVAICRSLDGIPLAIELAASRLVVLSAADLLDRLQDRFRLLRGGRRAGADRQRTLEAAFAWSYDLLPNPERQLFRRLATFHGGAFLGAIEATAAEVERRDVLPLLAELVMKSLLVAEPERAAKVRYRMLETLRQYAWERLSEAGELDETLAEHAAYFVRLAEEGYGERDGPQQMGWLEQLHVEQENLRSALEFLIEREPRLALQLAGALGWFWRRRGHTTEGLRWFERALLTAGAATAERARALAGASDLAVGQGDYEAARTFAKEGLRVAREASDLAGAGKALAMLGLAANSSGDNEAARGHLNDALAIQMRLGDRSAVAFTQFNLGRVAMASGEHSTARQQWSESLAVYTELRDRWGIAVTSGNLGLIALSESDLAGAVQLFETSLALHRELGVRSGLANRLDALGAVAAARGKNERAIRLAGSATALRARIHAVAPPYWQQICERWLAPARAKLGEKCAEVNREGEAMSVDEAVDYALAGDAAPPPHTGAGVEGLTTREREVAELVATGLTNPEIARKLVLSERTIDSHVEHIRGKLGVRTRAQIATWVVRGHGGR